MSSLFDVPAQLAMLLSVAAATPGHEAASLSSPLAALSESSDTAIEPLEGPLRFGEMAWLRALRADPAAAEGYAGRVFVTSGGRFYMPTVADRRRVLDARNDLEVAGRVARAAAERNAALMQAALHRAPTAGDLYIAHLFGAQTAIALIKAAAAGPDTALKVRFPELAGRLEGAEGARLAQITVGQLYRRLSGAVHEPPRLVAIGLRATVADAPHVDAPHDNGTRTIAWQATVDMAKSDRPIQ